MNILKNKNNLGNKIKEDNEEWLIAFHKGQVLRILKEQGKKQEPQDNWFIGEF